MRLYASPDGVWTGTQADAKAHAKQTNTTWKEVEVPTDKAGLLYFLNDHRVGSLAPDVSSAEILPEKIVEPVEQKPLPWAIRTLPLEEAIWDLPLDEAVKLGIVLMERIREFAREAAE